MSQETQDIVGVLNQLRGFNEELGRELERQEERIREHDEAAKAWRQWVEDELGLIVARLNRLEGS